MDIDHPQLDKNSFFDNSIRPSNTAKNAQATTAVGNQRAKLNNLRTTNVTVNSGKYL